MKKKHLFQMIIWVGISMLLISCQQSKKHTDETVDPTIEKEKLENEQKQTTAEPNSKEKIFIDSEGREIIFDKTPKTFISLSPSLTELIAYYGGDIIGRTSYCNYPESVQDAADIGTLLETNFEKIIELDADLVVTSSLTYPDTIQTLQDNNVKVVRVYEKDPTDMSVGSFEGIFKMMGEVGELMDKETEATDLIGKIEGIIAETEKKSASLAYKPRVYYMVMAGDGSDFAATGDTFVQEILDIVGADNIAKENKSWRYSLEELIDSDPDLIIVSDVSGYKEQLKEMQGYQDLTAVQTGNVYEFNSDLVDRTGPRLGEGIETLYDIIEAHVNER